MGCGGSSQPIDLIDQDPSNVPMKFANPMMTNETTTLKWTCVDEEEKRNILKLNSEINEFEPLIKIDRKRTSENESVKNGLEYKLFIASTDVCIAMAKETKRDGNVRQFSLWDGSEKMIAEITLTVSTNGLISKVTSFKSENESNQTEEAIYSTNTGMMKWRFKKSLLIYNNTSEVIAQTGSNLIDKQHYATDAFKNGVLASYGIQVAGGVDIISVALICIAHEMEQSNSNDAPPGL